MKKFIIFSLAIALISGGGYYIYWSTTKPYVFAPYESSSLTDKKSYLNEKDTEEIKKKIWEVQKIIDNFDDQSTVKDKNNAYFVLASHQQSIGLYLDAKKTLEASLEANMNTNILQAYAILLYNMGAKKAAIQYLDHLLKIAPQIPNYWRSKIELAHDVHSGDNNYMDDLYNQALKSTGNNIDILTVYAQFLWDTGRREEAKKYWEMAIEAHPPEAQLYQQQIDNLNK